MTTMHDDRRAPTMKYVFGPLPSRLLGRTLEVDPLALKTCNFNCVYCQLGRSRPMVAERDVYTPPAAILDELSQALLWHRDSIDWIEIGGSGEPTLHRELGEIIRGIKAQTKTPIAVHTNGSLLGLRDVRDGLRNADVVLPSIDAGDELGFCFVNRPHGSVSFLDYVQGLVRFRSEFSGKVWAQVMLVAGANDTVESLTKIRRVLDQFEPDEVHVLRPSRPPAEYWVALPDRTALGRALTILRASTRALEAKPKPVAEPSAPRS